MDLTNGDTPDTRELAAQLREAFDDHSRSARQPWSAEVRALPCDRPLSEDPGMAVVRVKLTITDVGALITILREAAQTRSSRRLNTNEVAALIQYRPATIRGWLKRNHPQDNPFPKPRKRLGRNEWDETVIEAWLKRQTALKEEHQRGRGPESQ